MLHCIYFAPNNHGKCDVSSFIFIIIRGEQDTGAQWWGVTDLLY